MATLRSWTIADFKALGDAHLTLPSLTVLAGANSSGKSSVIQSLLLMAQSVNRGGQVTMNGPLVRLGEPKDVVRDGQRSIQVSFEIDFEGGASTAEGARTRNVVSLAPDKDGARLVPVSMEIYSEADELVLAATTSRMSSSDVAVIANYGPVADATYLRVTHVSGRKAPSRMYLGCSGLLPTSLIVHKNPNNIFDFMTAVLSSSLGSKQIAFDVGQELSSLVPRDRFLRERGHSDYLETDTRRLQMSRRWSSRDLGELSEEDASLLIDRAADKRSESEWVVAIPTSPIFGPSYRTRRRSYDDGIMESALAADFDAELAALGGMVNALQSFGSRLRYLGPLRDEPRVVHGSWDERVHSLPVGSRGELTAEVLTRDKDSQISYRNRSGERMRGTLPDAVSEWCQYLGIGDGIRVLDLGKLGRGVELSVNGQNRDLTTIGVGASQLLPILVAGLSAPMGSLVLIEQPELHLHPKVQSRLADFFLYAKTGVRFIVETHSEYFVTRIRRRIAERLTAPESLEFLFAEQKSGATTIRRLQMTEMGDFDEWPDGFFDAQEDDVRHIVRAVGERLAAAKK
jgi:predicted ATPase